MQNLIINKGFELEAQEPVSSKGLRPVFSLVGLKIWTSVNFGLVSVSSKGASVVEDLL